MTSTKGRNLAGTLISLMVAAVLMVGTVSGFKAAERAVNSSSTKNVVLQADGTNPPAPPIKLPGSRHA